MIDRLLETFIPRATVRAGKHGAERQGLPAAQRLAPCPNTPNCVSTMATDPMHAIAPLSYSGSAALAHEILLGVVHSMGRSTVITDTEDYLHVEFRSRVFRFVDDVEFVIDEQARLIHFRSAARLGRGDLGVNRRRMERIRRAFERALAQTLATASSIPAGAEDRA